MIITFGNAIKPPYFWWRGVGEPHNLVIARRGSSHYVRMNRKGENVVLGQSFANLSDYEVNSTGEKFPFEVKKEWLDHIDRGLR